MSKKGLYRIDVAYFESYSGYVDGESVTVLSEALWLKGNIQPWKRGIEANLGEEGFRFSDWRVLFTRQLPEVTFNPPMPSSAQKGATYVWYEGQWYLFIGEQDWTTQARGVKHYELLLQKTEEPKGAITPVPINNLVLDFERAIQELNQATIIIEDL